MTRLLRIGTPYDSLELAARWTAYPVHVALSFA
jgi:hypothetical protein